MCTGMARSFKIVLISMPYSRRLFKQVTRSGCPTAATLQDLLWNLRIHSRSHSKWKMWKPVICFFALFHSNIFTQHFSGIPCLLEPPLYLLSSWLTSMIKNGVSEGFTLYSTFSPGTVWWKFCSLGCSRAQSTLCAALHVSWPHQESRHIIPSSRDLPSDYEHGHLFF